MTAGMISMLLPDRFVPDEVIPTTLTVGLYALGGLIIVAIRRKMRWTSNIAVASLLISMLIFVFMIWFEQHLNYTLEDIIYKAGFVSFLVSAICVHRLLISPLKSSIWFGQVCINAALVFGMITGVFLIILVIEQGFVWRWGDFAIRIIGLCTLATAGTSISAGAISFFGPRPEDDDPGVINSSIPVSLICPRCRSEVKAKSNSDARCTSCRLKIRVEIEEPRCACGYQLYQLESDVCPECGNSIDESDRWHSDIVAS